jgi:hypothetical protein
VEYYEYTYTQNGYTAEYKQTDAEGKVLMEGSEEYDSYGYILLADYYEYDGNERVRRHVYEYEYENEVSYTALHTVYDMDGEQISQETIRYPEE